MIQTTIKGIPMVGFSIERADFGGTYTKKEITSALKEAGIKYSFSDGYGGKVYTIYSGHWAINIEAKYEDVVSEWLWGKLDELPKVGEK